MAVPHTHFLYTELEWVYECMNEKKKKKKQMLLFSYRVLHDIWLMCHPRMTLYLMERQTGRERQNKRQMERKELLTCPELNFDVTNLLYNCSKRCFVFERKHKNVISLNNTSGLQQPVHAQGHWSTMTARNIQNLQLFRANLVPPLLAWDKGAVKLPVLLPVLGACLSD